MSVNAQALRVDEARGVIRDALGVEHPFSDDSARIVSLVPSITELLCDLGLAGQLVGRTGFCIHPKAVVRSVTKLGGTKDVNIGKLRALEPSHVIVNIDENEQPLYQQLLEFVPHVVVTHPLSPHDNIPLFQTLGALFDQRECAEHLLVALRDQFKKLSGASSLYPRQSVLYLIWKDPWMAVNRDTYIAEMLKLINWQVTCGPSEQRYPQILLGDFVGTVDRVLLSSEPYSFRGSHVAAVQRTFGEQTNVTLVDGEMLSWYGSRAIKGVGYLRELGTPERNNMQ